jgi:hypothetical protein
MVLRYTTPGVYLERLDANPQQLELRRTDVAGFVGLAERGPLHLPLKVESWRQYVTVFGDRTPQTYLAYAVAGFFENGGRTCWVVRAGNPDGALPAKVTLRIDGVGLLSVTAASPGAWGNEITIEPVWERDRIVQLRARAPGDRSQGLALRSEGRAHYDAPYSNLLGVDPASLTELAADDLVRIEAEQDRGATPVPLGASAPRAQLQGGSDGRTSLRLEHLIGADDPRSVWGLKAMERVEDVAFLAIPDLMVDQDVAPVPCRRPAANEPSAFSGDEILEAHEAMIASCTRTHDRIALLDLPLAMTQPAAIEHRVRLPGSSFGAIYHPWVLVDDPLRVRGLVRPVPPSGHVAGMFARTDRRRGVHKPPANELLEGVRDVSVRLDARSHGELNEANVNAIRPIPGRGILVLGARTLDRDVRWRYVNVRRLFSMIEETLDQQLQWLVFEPNNPGLWREIERTIAGFLERLYRLGMLDGASSDEAYSVRCDGTTNPPWETDQGRVTAIIGVQPPYPAEFVIVRLGLTKSGIQLDEREGRDV